MSSLMKAMNTTARTENGGVALHSTLNPVLDLFYQAGASRGKNINNLFHAAYADNPELTIRVMLWLRDIRGGAGERQQFKNLFTQLLSTFDGRSRNKNRALVQAVANKVPELGRFDDLHILFGTEFEDIAVAIIAQALRDENGLAAKWTPRQGPIAKVIRKAMGYKDPGEFRRMLTKLTKVVEQQMCANEWTSIEYGKLPSVASSRYMTAFHKHDPIGYQAYKDSLDKGEAKANAGALYPHDIIAKLGNRYGQIGAHNAVLEAQWKALPNYMDGCKENIIPVVDRSGSMQTGAGGSNTVTCMQVAEALGLYIAERNTGLFKNQFITFADNPRMVEVKALTVRERYRQMCAAQVGYTTNIQAVFQTILTQALAHNVPEAEMPTQILILSDMEFNDSQVQGKSLTAFEAARKMYEKAGYKLPRIVFWNIASRNGHNPVAANEQGAALVSGFSPGVMKGVLKGGMTPEQVMLDVILNERYNY